MKNQKKKKKKELEGERDKIEEKGKGDHSLVLFKAVERSSFLLEFILTASGAVFS